MTVGGAYIASAWSWCREEPVIWGRGHNFLSFPSSLGFNGHQLMIESLFLKALCQGSEGASRDEIRAVLEGGTAGDAGVSALCGPSNWIWSLTFSS